jgi:ATP-dependent protease HslVU (ClpYQ) peptidase subunit
MRGAEGDALRAFQRLKVTLLSSGGHLMRNEAEIASDWRFSQGSSVESYVFPLPLGFSQSQFDG